MADEEKAKRKIDKVMFGFWRSDPAIFGALSLLDKVSDPSYETMGIDSSNIERVSLRYNPNFVNTISRERLELVLVIEAFRIMLRHPTTRLKEPGHISHLSSSISINQLMNSDLQMLLQGLDDITPTPEKFGLPAQKAYEEYYRKLLERQQQIDEMIKKIWNSMSDKEKEDLINNAMNNAEGGEEQEGEGQGGEGQGGEGQEKKQQDGKDGDGFQKFKDEKDAMKNHNNPNGNSHQKWGKNNRFDADVKNFVEKMRGSNRNWGKYTGDHKETLMAILDPKVSHRDIIRKFSCSVLTGKSEPSRMKINRRWDLDRPGYRRIYQPNVIFGLDVSGSMSNEDLQYGLGVINRILYYAKITYIQFDTEIKKIEKNLSKARKDFKVHGRGGTSFHEIIKYADENTADGLIIYTDGEAPEPPKPKCKVLWLMHSKDAKPPVSWGYQVRLDRFADDRVW
jgi:predicted metal-dependent peptidase